MTKIYDGFIQVIEFVMSNVDLTMIAYIVLGVVVGALCF